jgi:peptidylprolyl isomerase
LRRLALPSLLVCLVALLAACGSSSGSPGTTTLGAPRPAGTLPTVSGSFGSTPTIVFPNASPPATLVADVLHRGSGQVVAKGDLLVANYVGQIWRGKVFDSSFSRHELAAFPIGVGEVIPGWDKGLVGQTIGSRVLLVLPPVDGYGTAGNSQAGITGKDTLAFVVDLVASYDKTAAGDPNAVPQKLPSGIPVVTGPLGAPPKLTIPKGLKPPSKTAVVLLDKGHGAKATAGMMILQYVVVQWSTGKVVESTWTTGTPDGELIGPSVEGSSVLDGLVGMPIGSRLLLEIPTLTTSSGTTPAAAISLDIVAEVADPQK